MVGCLAAVPAVDEVDDDGADGRANGDDGGGDFDLDESPRPWFLSRLRRLIASARWFVASFSFF